MKQIRIYIYVVAAGLAAGCSRSESLPEAEYIQLYSRVETSAATKAPVTAETPFTAQVCGWESATEVADLLTPVAWDNTVTLTAGSGETEIHLDPLRKYAPGLTTTIRAWHPTALPVEGRVAFANTLGDVDVLLTQSVAGTLPAPIQAPLVFEHLSTQLLFRIVSDGWNPDEPITGITLKGVCLPIGLDVATGTLLVSQPTDLPVQGLAAAGVPIPEAPTAVGRPLMVAPISGNRFWIEVTTPIATYRGIPVSTPDPAFIAGRAYTATLTFNRFFDITTGSSIGRWETGGSGEGELEE